MKYELLNGKTVDIPLSLYLSMSDEEWKYEYQELMSFNFGENITDIWHDSYLRNPIKSNPVDPNLEKEEDLPDLFSLSSQEKLDDLDLSDPMD